MQSSNIISASKKTPSIGTGLRLGTMLLDHFFMCIVATVCFLPGFILLLSDTLSAATGFPEDGFLNGPSFYGFMLALALYLCKDVVNGRSLAKRALKLQVVHNSTGEPAGPMQCLVRNLLIIIWPVEVIAALVNPQRRLGDYIAGTRLVVYNTKEEQPKVPLLKMLLPLLLSYVLVLVLAQAVTSIRFTGTSRHIPASLNVAAGRELEQLLTDSLGEYGMASAKVYDSIQNSKLRYVTVLLRLQENYLQDDHQAFALRKKTEQLIYTKLPERTITGTCRFIYLGGGQMISHEVPIGITIIE